MNDNRTSRNVQVDYITVNGITHQAENQATNTGVWQNSQRGGGIQWDINQHGGNLVSAMRF